MRDCVLVHGGWGGAWCWEEVVPLLADPRGRVFTPTLTGLAERAGEGGPDVGMSTHIEDIVRVIDAHDLRDVVLVGHSYGGMPITGAAHRRPDRVSDLVYLDALVPRDGQSCADVLGPEFVDLARAEMARAGTPDAIPWLFRIEDILGTGPQAERVARRMTPQPAGTLFEPVVTTNAHAVRKTFVYCTGSAGLGLTETFAIAARNAPEWEYHEVSSPHDALHAQPAAVAELVRSVASR